MKPVPFEYSRPETADEAVRMLAEMPGARVLAGGQSLMPQMNFRQMQPPRLIDINRLHELDYMRADGDRFVIGAMTRHRTIEFSPMMAERMPLVVAAVRRLGHRQTRNRGTVGGSLCQLDPSAELALMSCIHDGVITLRRVQGERHVDMASFAVGACQSIKRDDELFMSLSLAPWMPGHGWGFHEFTRRHADWAIATAAALMTLDSRGRIDKVAVALGAVEDTPRRLPEVEAMLIGMSCDDATLDEAAAAAASDLQPRDDVAAPAWYRAHLAQVLMRRALSDAVARARHGGALPDMKESR